ncbi:DUF5677 domain-containing protein [Streptomyces goshikiensis]|uniref:DUF5677 domain-containing protein n=1 Tax=Streptomyces goshikiensis TaxID=1942 RepID=UPI0036C4DE52
MSAGDDSTAAMLTDAAHMTIKELADAFEKVAGDAVAVRAEHRLAFLAGFGWWAKIARTARGVSAMARGELTSEATPLTRVIMEHTLALKWLLDGAPDTVFALEEEGLENQRQLIEEAAKAAWELPDWVSGQQLSTKGDEHPLREEYSSFLRLTQLYGEKDTYVAYRLTSAHVHASATGSKAFLNEENGTISLRPSPTEDNAPLTHAAYCLLQATKMMDPLLVDGPLQSAITRSELLFGRSAHMPQRVPSPPQKTPVVPTRVQVTSADLDDAQALAAIVSAALRRSGAELGQEHVSARRRRVMLDVDSLPPASPPAP